jgi:cation diffusion facilitator CzcD-associated flavoprotein CzcO
MKALVMGGGMSGLAVAVNLLDLGLEVELVEAEALFGGRASSWRDEDGDVIDLGDRQFEVIHTPGHSPGGIALASPWRLTLRVSSGPAALTAQRVLLVRLFDESGAVFASLPVLQPGTVTGG